MAHGPPLPARRYPERPDCWHVFFTATFHVGTIARRTGNPHDTDSWEMALAAFLSGLASGRMHRRHGPTSFDRKPARPSMPHGRCFLSNRTEADFQAWRDQRDWTCLKRVLESSRLTLTFRFAK